MSSSGDGPVGTADVRGRTVVWSAGSPAAVRRRRTRPVLRWAALLLVAALASFGLAYAVHTYVVVAPPPAGPAAPLWLPDQLPPDDSADRAPSARPTSSRSPEPGDDRDARTDERGKDDRDGGSGRDDRGTDDRGKDDRPRTAASTGAERTVTSGHRPRSSSGSSHDGGDDRPSGSSGSGGHTSGGGSSTTTRGGSDDGGSGSTSGSGSGGSASGSGSGSGSGSHGGSGRGGSDDRGSGGSDDSGHGGSGSGGSDDGSGKSHGSDDD